MHETLWGPQTALAVGGTAAVGFGRWAEPRQMPGPA